jgi:hypothetical protein
MVTALIVYINDIVVTENDNEEIQNLTNYIANEFEVKDLDSLKYFQGMEVARSKHGIFISQQKYVLHLLKETGVLGCKAMDNPVEMNVKLGESSESPPVERKVDISIGWKVGFICLTHVPTSYMLLVL